MKDNGLLVTIIEHLITMEELKLKSYNDMDKRKCIRSIEYSNGKIEAYKSVLSLMNVIESE